MRLLEFQDNNKEAKKLSLERLLEDCKNIDKVLHYQNLSYILKVICLELISKYHDNLLKSHSSMEKS